MSSTTLDSARWWCPNCGIERTGDSLIKPCNCIFVPHRLERQKILRAEKRAAELYAEEQVRAKEARRKFVGEVEAGIRDLRESGVIA